MSHTIVHSEEPNKRVRIEPIGDGQPNYLPVSTYTGNTGGTSSSSLMAPPQPHATSTSSTSERTHAPTTMPMSPLLTHTPPSWMAEVPAFLQAVQQHEPTIPDEVVQHLLERSGCNCPDPKLIRLVGIATQHFLYDVIHDARQYHKLRTKDKANTELTHADLASALEAHGINLSKSEYYADNVFAGGMLNVNAAVQPTQANVQANLKDKGEKATKKGR